MSMLRRVLDRDAWLKSNLTQTLVDSVKELQLKHVAERSCSLTNDETTNALCYCLEAIFIHGLKNPFLKSMSSVLNTSRENQNPEPSFWEFLLIFCHQDVILQINSLSLIRTDIGRCRAWLRIVLNDGLLISYVQLIMSDKKMLKEYYKPNAFLRDSERCDLVKSYLYGIESYAFQLASNSSLLNSWNSTPLSLVGLWTPADSVAQGVDVAENMEAKVLQALPNLMLQSSTPPKHFHPPYDSAFGRTPLLEEEEALRIILSSKGSTTSSANKSSTSSSRKHSGEELPQRIDLPDTSVPSFHSSTGSSKSSRLSRPGAEGTVEGNRENIFSTHPSTQGAVISSDGHESMENSGRLSSEGNHERVGRITVGDGMGIETNGIPIPVSSPQDEGSYAALFKSYSRSESVIGTPIGVGSPVTIGSFLESNYFQQFLKNQPETTTSSPLGTDTSGPENHRESFPSDTDFEIVPRSEDFPKLQESGEPFHLPPSLQKIIQTIPNETGLDAQNYRCKQCERPIGMIYGAARVCGFSGNYYCSECHLNDEFLIPSRILMNWDFTRFSVSSKARDFLHEIYDKPIFDLNEINPKLYQEVEECSELLKLRTQLKYISIYLQTCKDSSIEELKHEVLLREHLYRNIHLYSISDLLNIPNRNLASALVKLGTLGSSHIKSCEICRQKAFVCEICRANEVIFPFELETTFKCLTCGAVYHSKCMNNNATCPRCKRFPQFTENPS